jgi:UDP-2-acetamido-2,6-beta-L-arabino-hexul-4-ose reductase
VAEVKRVLVTGAAGFIGRNLVLALRRRSGFEVRETDVETPAAALAAALADCDVVFHLAGINRPEDPGEFERGNAESLRTVLEILCRRDRPPVLVLSSSAQALLDNPYGRSKKNAEDALLKYAAEAKAAVRIFRLPGVFGKWGRPNYNSVVATFCYNTARGLPLQITDPGREIEIVHVDDVVAAFQSAAGEAQGEPRFERVEPVFRVTLGRLASLLGEFRENRDTLQIPDLADPFLRKLYGTYLAYLPPAGFAYDLVQKTDSRGTLAELLKLGGRGQVFVSRTHPGVTRGRHYHDLKFEKFVVLEGEAVIEFRHMATNETASYPVAGTDFRVVDIPPGWTHTITNVGRSEMVVLFWSSEVFDPARADTFPAEVKP